MSISASTLRVSSLSYARRPASRGALARIRDAFFLGEPEFEAALASVPVGPLVSEA